MESPAKVPTIEQRIGRYVLLEPVGRGAMGVVYRAEDPFIHRTVAVKILHTTNGLTPEQVGTARERFTREARAAGSIDHPNVIRILDVGKANESGELFIVMEYVAGADLEGMLKEEDFDFERAVDLIGQIAAGLDAAHARGIIHRDIKPSNILLTKDGTPKIADFGITRIETSCLTQDMKELGTPAYMSPEQVKGQPLDFRSDLFSLGLLSYEILAGRKPFDGNDPVSMAYAIAHAQPTPISIVNPALPQELDRVMERILAKEPSERFATGREFHEACLECLPNRVAPGPATPAIVSIHRKHVIFGLAGAALLAVVFAVVAWSSRGRQAALPPPGVPPPPPQAQVAPKAASVKAATIATPSTVRPVRKAGLVPKPPAPLRKPAEPEPRAAGASPVAAVPAIEKPASRAPVKEAASARQLAPTANVTISLGHRMRQGSLVVLLDGVVVFDETFSKSKMALFQTTTWDPVNTAAGAHKLSARVNGEDGKIYRSEEYPVEFSQGKSIALRFSVKGDALTVKQSSGL